MMQATELPQLIAYYPVTDQLALQPSQSKDILVFTFFSRHIGEHLREDTYQLFYAEPAIKGLYAGAGFFC